MCPIGIHNFTKYCQNARVFYLDTFNISHITSRLCTTRIHDTTPPARRYFSGPTTQLNWLFNDFAYNTICTWVNTNDMYRTRMHICMLKCQQKYYMRNAQLTQATWSGGVLLTTRYTRKGRKFNETSLVYIQDMYPRQFSLHMCIFVPKFMSVYFFVTATVSFQRSPALISNLRNSQYTLIFRGMFIYINIPRIIRVNEEIPQKRLTRVCSNDSGNVEVELNYERRGQRQYVCGR